MAADWTKMRTDLYRDPKVSHLADEMMHPEGQLALHVCQITHFDMSVTRNVMRNAVCGALLSVWGVARHQGKRQDDDLVLRGATPFTVDDIADLPGFGAAMLKVGWLEESPDGLVFPRFFCEHNVDPKDEQRAKNAERQRQFRQRKRNVTRNVTVTPKSNAREREEKEESYIYTPGAIPVRLNSKKVREAFQSWCRYLDAKAPEKIPDDVSVEIFWKQQLNRGPDGFVQAVEHTIANGWLNLRDPAQSKPQTNEELHAELFGGAA